MTEIGGINIDEGLKIEKIKLIYYRTYSNQMYDYFLGYRSTCY